MNEKTTMLKSLQIKLLFIFLLLSVDTIGITRVFTLTTTPQTDLQNDTTFPLGQNTSTTPESPAVNKTMSKTELKQNPNQNLKVLFTQVITPTLCVLGIIGNIINLLVLTRKDMQGSTNCFLIALAVSDMLLLTMQILPTAISTTRWKGMSRTYIIASRYLVVIRYFTSNVFITCTSWLTVAITIERFIAIRFALKARLMCTIHRAKVAITAIFIISFLFHLSKCFEYAPNMNHTSPKPVDMQALANNKIYDTLMHVLNIAVAVFIPEVSLFILNTLLIYFLVQHNRSMRHIKDKGRQELLQLTLVVITMVSVFMICHSIGLYLAINIAIYSRKQVLFTVIGERLRIINNFLVLVNSSVNFILYTAISKRFRDSFNKIISQCSRKIKKKPVLTLKTSSSSNTNSTGISQNSNGTETKV